FVGPAAAAAERGLPVDALVAAMGAALEFDEPSDEQSVELQRRIREEDAAAFTADVTGLEPQHPLYPRVEAVVRARQAELGV
ncbi:MAG: mannitol-1-phosphate 5-dehydrogenase, partial [Microbacterium sp.]